MPAALIADLDDLDLEATKALIRTQHDQLSSRASEIAPLKLLLDKFAADALRSEEREARPAGRASWNFSSKN